MILAPTFAIMFILQDQLFFDTKTCTPSARMGIPGWDLKENMHGTHRCSHAIKGVLTQSVAARGTMICCGVVGLYVMTTTGQASQQDEMSVPQPRQSLIPAPYPHVMVCLCDIFVDLRAGTAWHSVWHIREVMLPEIQGKLEAELRKPERQQSPDIIQNLKQVKAQRREASER